MYVCPLLPLSIYPLFILIVSCHLPKNSHNPLDFMFKLTKDEFSRSQIVTLNKGRGCN